MTLAKAIQVACCILSIFVMYRALSMRNSVKTRYFILLSIAIFLYSSGYLLEMDSHTVEAAFFAQRIQYFGIPVIMVFMYLFIRDYANRGIPQTWRLLPLFIFPVIIMVSANMYPHNKWLFESLSLGTEPSVHLVVEPGPLFALNAVHGTCYILLSISEVLRHFPRTNKRQNTTRLIFVLAASLPSIAIFTMSYYSTYPMNFGPVALVIMLTILGSFILYQRPEDWLPYARETVVETLNDGFVLVGREGDFIDANEVACSYFPQMKHIDSPTKISEIDGFPAHILENVCETHEFAHKVGDKELYLRASATPIDYNGKYACTCIMLYDVTELHKLMLELEESATVDSLTGLLNRGTFFKLATRDFALVQRNKHITSLVMIDLDHFKDVNDMFGHQTGDEVLRAIAKAIDGRLRQTDVAGRYGGEEFCFFLPATDLEGAFQIADDIRQEIAQLEFEANDVVFSITISAGIAQLDPIRHQTLEDAIADADAALYCAKRSGRNRVTSYEPPKEMTLL